MAFYLRTSSMGLGTGHCMSTSIDKALLESGLGRKCSLDTMRQIGSHASGTDAGSAMGMDRAIVRCSNDEVVPGKLGEHFQQGAKAVLVDDPRVAWIWNRMVDLPTTACPADSGILSTSEDFLFQIARNHISRNHKAGDMLRFIPGGIGHVARKIVFTRKENGRFETSPRNFSGDIVPLELLDTAWTIMTDLLHSTFPAKLPLPKYNVSLEILKYPHSFEEIERIGSLLGDSCGEWTRIGMVMDTWKAQATGLFDIKFIRDCTAILSVIPGLNRILSAINGWMLPYSLKSVRDGSSIVGAPHCDGGKILTALVGDRSTLTTEVYTGRQWKTLPLTSSRLAILPSQQIDRRLGIEPTLHRILIQDRLHADQPVKRNITLCITASLG